MFTTYLVTAFRNLLKGKLYSVINILGLSLGLAAAIMILLYVQHELTADRHHEHFDELYRVGIEIGIGGPPVKAAVSSYAAGPALKELFPGVTDFVRFGSLDMMLSDALVEYNDNTLYEQGILLVDSNFFDLFTHPVVYGDPEAALRHNDVAVLTRSSAERIFGPGNPVGKQFRLAQEYNIEVGAVIEDIPENSHLKFRILLFWNSLNQLAAGPMSSGSFFDNNVFTYLRSGSDLNTPEMQQKLQTFIEDHVLAGEPIGNTDLVFKWNLRPLSDLYFLKDELYEPANPEKIPAKGNRMFVFVFITVAVFLTVIASINYMNMAVARSGRRSKEVGVRKVLGADRGSLIRQFLSESMLTVVIALLIALLWVELLLPVVNHLLMKDLAFNLLLSDWKIIGVVLLLTLITGLLSGSYPAFYLSHFRPSDVLKSQMALSDRNLLIRKVLVGLQFTISVFMVIATFVVMQQLAYMRNKDLGYTTENMMVLNVADLPQERRVSFQRAVDQLAGVEKTSLANSIPGPGSILPNWGLSVETREGFMERMLPLYMVDAHFRDVYDIEMNLGRFFDPDQPTDLADAVVVNEAAVRLFEWENPIGMRLGRAGRNDYKRVVGVVSNFHVSSLESDIVPLVILGEGNGAFLHVKLSPGPVRERVSAVQEVWQEMAGFLPLRYEFLEDRHRMSYLTQENQGRLFGLFALLCIFLSLMGLFGLSGFSAEQKTKEIGIRVVHGASLSNILGLLYKDYGMLMLLSIVIASGAAVFFLENWLAQFAFRIDIGILPFVTAALLAITISVATVGYHAWRILHQNPVEALRHE